MTRVAVIGNGLLGTTLYDAATAGADRLLLLNHDDVDITSESSIRAMLHMFYPDVVVNTAAFHQLNACENDPERAFDINARAAGRLARLVPTIYISTDYVFHDGGPHDECLPGREPRSVYGRSKLAGEMVTLEEGGCVVRVAGLYGHHRSHKGPTFPETLLSSHDPIRLPTDQRFSPTYAPHAAGRILAIAADPERSGVYHAANDGATSWAEFAEHILALTRHRRHVLPYQAKDVLRPRNSSLQSTRFPPLPHWTLGLYAWAETNGAVKYVSPKRDV